MRDGRKALKQLLKEHQKDNISMSNFCAAPFVHMYVHSNEGERVCCMSTEKGLVTKNTELDLKKRWTSDYYKNIRKAFLRNERLDICVKCYELEEHGGRSDRHNFNNMYLQEGRRREGKLVELIPNVETGNQFDAPWDLDIRPGNLCNLKCRMCGPVSSSQFQQEVQKHKFMEPLFGKGEFQTSDCLSGEENIQFLLQACENGDRVKFLGGEPTIMPEVDRMLDILIEKNLTHVPLHFTTNCTNNNKRFIDKISQFKKITFNYSIDGIEKTLEYIRAPVKYETVNTTLPIYHNLAMRDYSEISYTLQAYNVFNLGDTIKWACGHGVMLRPEILRWPEWASLRSIPYEIRHKEFKRVLDELSNSRYKRHLKKIIPAIEQAMADKEEYHPKHLARATKMFDKARNQHCKDYLPEVWDIIKEEYHDIQV